ncbi:hypothetical protein RHGRI_000160 [Rhododendron griersonianum]|uniref:PGG domain-containing protein n=1 Tax=Rhododendron griersonianum TaxID=479676 RepID=A0AAV6LIR5_9ERIC|nr:hypothetical protein RHGRI_000160 [Rhododendron griersonianum]
MEELLCDAAIRGDLESLHEIIAKDNYILDKVLVGSFKGKSKVDVLKKLVQICPRAAQVILDRGDTILHQCVNYNQLESLRLLLEMIRDPEFIESKDANGNTILHTAVFGKRFEVIKYVVLIHTEIYVNAINGAGWTAMDIYFFVQNHPHRKEVDVRIENFLRATAAKRCRQMALMIPSPRGKKLMQTLMVVSSLFATMAFQVGVNPPGGVWQDNFKEHIAGKAIIAYKYPKSYSYMLHVFQHGRIPSVFIFNLVSPIGFCATAPKMS